MSVFWSSPFSLSQGDLIKVKVRAINSVGSGSYSDLNSVGATVYTKPLDPSSSPSKVSATVS
jgi:hypothetical protein